MAYTDFTLESVCRRFTLNLGTAALFPGLVPLPLPQWLEEHLRRGGAMAWNSEKSRSEFIVAPVLLAVRENVDAAISIFSGQRLDADPAEGLVGECDFILAGTPPLPILQTPLVCIVEAKKNDIESGLGQCAAQMVGAQMVNRRDMSERDTIFGCVTTGEVWQFLHLAGNDLRLDDRRYYLDNLGFVLAAFDTAIR
jgi:hypothetical protein